MQDTQSILTNKQLFSKLVPIFSEIISLEADAKALKEDADESGLDYSAVASLAKAAAKQKLGSVQEKAESVLALLDEIQ